MPKKILTETNSLIEKKASYYDLLRLKPSATSEDIKKAYRKLSKQLHPDRNYNDKELATEVFKHIVKAYETLTDVNVRSAYDAKINGLEKEYNYFKNINNFKEKYVRKRGFFKNLFKKRKSHEIVAEEIDKIMKNFLKEPTRTNLEKIKTAVKQGKQALKASKQESMFRLGTSSLEKLLVNLEKKILELSPTTENQTYKEEVKSTTYNKR